MPSKDVVKTETLTYSIFWTETTFLTGIILNCNFISCSSFAGNHVLTLYDDISQMQSTRTKQPNIHLIYIL